MGVERLTDIPDDFRLSVIQQRMVTCAHTGRPYFDAGVRDRLAELRYPLSFMDFETFNAALPRYPGMRPYDQIPFQWSVHVQPAPGADPQHYEFLVEEASDPREPFLESLLKVLEEQGGDGHIVVYNQSFERARLKDLAEWLPRYARRIDPVQDRIWDLLPVVRENVYHPEFCGSFSIKNVFPAIVAGMSYDGMEVSEGGEAGLAYDRKVRGDVSTTERKRLRHALLGYCKQDTLAMVRLIECQGAR